MIAWRRSLELCLGVSMPRGFSDLVLLVQLSCPSKCPKHPLRYRYQAFSGPAIRESGPRALKPVPADLNNNSNDDQEPGTTTTAIQGDITHPCSVSECIIEVTVIAAYRG